MGSLANWVMNGDELGAIGKRRFHLHLADHFADAFHDLIAGQYLAACGHELGDGPAVARSLHHEVGYQRDAFGVVELDASCESSPRDKRRDRDHQLVSFTRGELHWILRSWCAFSMTTSSARGTARFRALPRIAGASCARRAASRKTPLRQNEPRQARPQTSRRSDSPGKEQYRAQAPAVRRAVGRNR